MKVKAVLITSDSLSALQTENKSLVIKVVKIRQTNFPLINVGWAYGHIKLIDVRRPQCMNAKQEPQDHFTAIYCHSEANTTSANVV